MSKPHDDEKELAGKVAAFIDKHGMEKAGETLCRALLSLAEAKNAASIQYSDAMGEVHVRTLKLDDTKLH